MSKADNTKPDNTEPDNTEPDNTEPDNTKPGAMSDLTPNPKSTGHSPESSSPAAVLAALLARRAELLAEVTELAEPIRAPGVQVQFGKRAGDHTSDAVLQMTRSVTAGELNQLTIEIDRAISKVEEGTYGVCDACGAPIAPERLEALPWAVLCVRCKSAPRAPSPGV
ncbi:MAG: TraR/DksA family transcriptional regulator [Acidimicrobiales bacterium]